VAIMTGTLVMVKVWQGNFDFGIDAMLTYGFVLPGFLFCRRYPRLSPGVVVAAGGFILWGAVFPVGAWMDALWPNLKVNPELWNTPKYFVAFGMILTLLEDKSEVLRSAGHREQKLNLQLQRFSGITSRLLSGVDVSSVCN